MERLVSSFRDDVANSWLLLKVFHPPNLLVSCNEERPPLLPFEEVQMTLSSTREGANFTYWCQHSHLGHVTT